MSRQPSDLEDILSTTGKARFSDLKEIAQTLSKERFVSFFKVPALVGKTIRSGEIERSDSPRKKTMLFIKSKELVEESRQFEALSESVYPLLKRVHLDAINTSGYVIGSKAGADIVMPDFAISEKHAVINFKHPSYIIKDLGSTNGTILDGKPIGLQEVVLKDQQVLSFGRYEFWFFRPESLYQKLKEAKT